MPAHSLFLSNLMTAAKAPSCSTSTQMVFQVPDDVHRWCSRWCSKMVFKDGVQDMVFKPGIQTRCSKTVFKHGAMKQSAKPKGEETYLCQDMKNGVQRVAKDMSCVAFGWTGIVQRLNGIVQILHTNLSHHRNQDISGIVPAHQPRPSQSEEGTRQGTRCMWMKSP